MDLILEKDLFLLDFDGTLVNTAPDVQAAVNFMRGIYGLNNISLEEAMKLIGKGQTYTVCTAIAEGVGVDWRKAEEQYRVYYEKNLAENSVLYPGVIKFLEKLKVNGKQIGIISNKYSYYVRGILEKLRCQNYFSFICGPDIVQAKKPDPQMVFYAIEKTGISLHRTVLIGDSVYDIQTGKNAGITTVCVTHGYGNYEEIIGEAPDYLMDKQWNFINE